MTSIGNFSAVPGMKPVARPKAAPRPRLRFAGDAPPPADNPPVKTGGFKNGMRMLMAMLLGANALTGVGYISNKNENQQLRSDFATLQSESEAHKRIFAHIQEEMAKGEKSLNEILADIRESVHSVDVMNRVAKAGVRIEGRYALGSGTFFRDDKGQLYILTNSHVVDTNSINRDDDGHPRFKVRLYNGDDTAQATEVEAELVRLSNGNFIESPWERGKDLALLKVVEYPDQPAFNPPHFLTPHDFRDLSKEPLRVGEPVFLVGTPRGLTDSVSPGFISHIQRKTPWNSHVISVQSNAPANPGNSGGALYDAQGRWIGVLNSGYPGTDGLNFSIRIDSVLGFLKENGINVTPG